MKSVYFAYKTFAMCSGLCRTVEPPRVARRSPSVAFQCKTFYARYTPLRKPTRRSLREYVVSEAQSWQSVSYTLEFLGRRRCLICPFLVLASVLFAPRFLAKLDEETSALNVAVCVCVCVQQFYKFFSRKNCA